MYITCNTPLTPARSRCLTQLDSSLYVGEESSKTLARNKTLEGHYSPQIVEQYWQILGNVLSKGLDNHLSHFLGVAFGPPDFLGFLLLPCWAHALTVECVKLSRNLGPPNYHPTATSSFPQPHFISTLKMLLLPRSSLLLLPCQHYVHCGNSLFAKYSSTTP